MAAGRGYLQAVQRHADRGGQPFLLGGDDHRCWRGPRVEQQRWRVSGGLGGLAPDGRRDDRGGSIVGGDELDEFVAACGAVAQRTAEGVAHPGGWNEVHRRRGDRQSTPMLRPTRWVVNRRRAWPRPAASRRAWLDDCNTWTLPPISSLYVELRRSQPGAVTGF